MDTKYTEIECLKLEIEKRMGKPLKSPTDFNQLSLRLQKELKEEISISTIKRIWGYVEAKHNTRYTTLSILSRFIGYIDWYDFCLSLRRRNIMERDAMPEKQIRTASLKTGDKIELGWAPDCTCEIEYIGDSCFRVEESSNNKLCKGDTFKTLIFNLNKPLYVSELRTRRQQAVYLHNRKGQRTDNSATYNRTVRRQGKITTCKTKPRKSSDCITRTYKRLIRSEPL